MLSLNTHLRGGQPVHQEAADPINRLRDDLNVKRSGEVHKQTFTPAFQVSPDALDRLEPGCPPSSGWRQGQDYLADEGLPNPSKPAISNLNRLIPVQPFLESESRVRGAQVSLILS